MRFRVRDGYHAVLRKFEHDPVTGKVTSFTDRRIDGGKEADFTAKEAGQHLAKLEPVDKEARQFMDDHMQKHGMRHIAIVDRPAA